MEEIKLKVEYDDNSAYVRFDGMIYNLSLNKQDYGCFTIKEIIYESIDTYVVIETNDITISYGEYMKFKEQEHKLDTIKSLVNKYEVAYYAEACENNFVEFLETVSDIVKED